MKRICSVFALAMMLALTTTAAQAKDATESAGKKEVKAGDITATLEAKEREIQDAFKNKDVATFMKLVDDGAWGTDPSGTMAVKEMVPQVMQQMEVRSSSMEGFKTLMISKDAYVAVYSWKADISVAGQTMPPGPWYCSTVWAKRGKEWKAVYHQETLAMQPSASAESK